MTWYVIEWVCNVAIQWVVCFSVTEGSCEEMSAEASFRFFSFVPKHPLPLVVRHSSVCAGRPEIYNLYLTCLSHLFKSQTQKIYKRIRRQREKWPFLAFYAFILLLWLIFPLISFKRSVVCIVTQHTDLI